MPNIIYSYTGTGNSLAASKWAYIDFSGIGYGDIMEDNFLKYWFRGFGRSLQTLDADSRNALLKECGKSCSDSYTKQIYLDAYKVSQSLDDFLCQLKIKLPEIEFRIIKPDEIIELTYHYCACDLVKKNYIKTPLLCECSRQSLLYNWGSIFGSDKVTVHLQESILKDDLSCKFLIHLVCAGGLQFRM